MARLKALKYICDRSLVVTIPSVIVIIFIYVNSFDKNIHCMFFSKSWILKKFNYANSNDYSYIIYIINFVLSNLVYVHPPKLSFACSISIALLHSKRFQRAIWTIPYQLRTIKLSTWRTSITHVYPIEARMMSEKIV